MSCCGAHTNAVSVGTSDRTHAASKNLFSVVLNIHEYRHCVFETLPFEALRSPQALEERGPHSALSSWPKGQTLEREESVGDDVAIQSTTETPTSTGLPQSGQTPSFAMTKKWVGIRQKGAFEDFLFRPDPTP